MADLLLGGGDAAVDLIGRIGAAAREPAAEFSVVAHADKDRDQRGGEKRVGGTLGADRGGALNVDVEERIETSTKVRGDIGGAWAVEVTMHGGVFEEDARADLLLEATARQEMVVGSVRLTGARRTGRAGDDAADSLRVGFG